MQTGLRGASGGATTVGPSTIPLATTGPTVATGTSFRNNMSSFIRDTLYSLPHRGGNGAPPGDAAPGVTGRGMAATTSTARPTTSGSVNGAFATAPSAGGPAGATGSHSSKFAVLNSLQQQQHAGSNAIDPLGAPPPASTNNRAGQPRAPGLDLSSLLAGVAGPASHSSAVSGQHTQPSAVAPHGAGGVSLVASSSGDQGGADARKPKVPRTLSGRPRPTATGGVVVAPPVGVNGAGIGGGPASIASIPMTKPTPRGVVPVMPQQSSARATGDVFASDGDGGDVFAPREDNTASALTLNPAASQQVGLQPSLGNSTARGAAPQPVTATASLMARGRPSSAAVAEHEPNAPASSASAAGLAAPAAGTMAALGGCAVGPEFRGMQPARVLALYEPQLSRYERREVLDYDDVYFIGPEAAKPDAPVANAPNFGYDDDRGDYLVTKADHIAYRYEVLGELGKGSFGQVLKVKDYKRNCECALKIIRNRKRFHQQAQVEIRLLEHLRSKDPDDRSCTVRMLNYFQFRAHTCITFELHAMNLYELTKLNRYQPFPPPLIKRFTGQLLVAVSFMWREQIVHCDLKPENILLKQENKTGIKVIDFGSSCFESERVYTYIQSRFYRAPEIMLGLPYGRPIDLWSIGCIICEMAIGFPIFPGENEHEQLLCIMEVLGVPPARLSDKSPRKSKFFDTNGQPRLVPNSRNKIRRPSTKDLQSILRTDDLTFVDFILKFLKWDPSERVTPNEAMRHPYIAECFHQDTIPPGPATAGGQLGNSTSSSAAVGVPSTPSAAGKASRPGSSAPQTTQAFPEPQPSAPLAVASHHQRHMSATRETKGSVTRVQPALHQLGSLNTSAIGGGSSTSRGALPSIGSGPTQPASLVPSSARRPKPPTASSRAVPFSGAEMFL